MTEKGEPIEAIWKEAFETGHACRLVGRTLKRGSFTMAWFSCNDGRVFPLSKADLLRYKPDAKVSKTYKKPKMNARLSAGSKP